MGEKKGQVAMEFFSYSALFLVLFMVVLAAVSVIQKAELEGRNIALAKEKISRFAFVLATIGESEKGTHYVFTPGGSVNGMDYEIEVRRGIARIVLKDGKGTTFSYPTYEGEIEGRCKKRDGWIVIKPKGNVVMEKGERGVIIWQEC